MSMMNASGEVKIEKNILPPETNLDILKMLVNIPWYVCVDNDTESKLEKVFNKSAGFQHATFNHGKTETPHTLNYYGKIVFQMVCDRLKIKGELFRIYWNMYFQGDECKLHKDHQENGYKSILYNLHTTDGGTEVNGIRYDDIMGEAKIFDSNILHRGLPCKIDKVRFNLNIIFKEIK